jgi:hypothetical protein
VGGRPIQRHQVSDACDKVEKGDVCCRDLIERASLKKGLES